jgi:hypothetical protein
MGGLARVEHTKKPHGWLPYTSDPFDLPSFENDRDRFPEADIKGDSTPHVPTGIASE